MTPSELAALRDKVARARIQKAGRARDRRAPVRQWAPEREAAGNAALEALREATRRAQPKRTPRKTASVRAVVKKLRGPCCVYCGGHAIRGHWQSVCHGHSDLPMLDPAYQGELLLRGMVA